MARRTISTPALFALDILGAQWHQKGHLLIPYSDPVFEDVFAVYTIKKSPGGDLAFNRHLVTKKDGEYTCNCQAFKYRRNHPAFMDKHIAAVLEAQCLPSEPAALYLKWKQYNDYKAIDETAPPN
jgi:hypothetical protein